MKNRTTWFIANILVMGIFLFTACGPKAAAPTTTITPTPATPTPAAPVPGAPLPVPVAAKANTIEVTLKKMDGTTMKKAVEKPQYGGTLNVLRSVGDADFDLTKMSGSNFHFMFLNSLLHGDWAKGTAGTGEISWQIYEYMSMDHFMPSLAESWEMPDDGTIIYHIRKGVRWAMDEKEASKLVGGRELTADDVVFSLKYHFFRTPATALKSTYGRVVEKADIRSPDKYTVIVKAPKQDLYQFLGFMSDLLPIIPPEIVQKYGDFTKWNQLVTTGAFTIKDHVAGSVTTLVKNTNYWEDDPILGKDYRLPYVDSIKYFNIPDSSTQEASVRTGKLDGTVTLDKEKWENLIKNTPRLKTKIVNFGTSSNRIAMQMNDPKAPWQDIRVRRALMMAINHQEIVDTYFKGGADVQAFPLPGAPELYALGWAIPLKQLPRETQKLFEYHPDEAKKLLAEAGYPNGFKTSLMISSTSAEWQDLGAMIKEYWAKVGIELTLDIRDSAVHTGYLTSATQPAMIHDGKWGTATLYTKYDAPPNFMNSGNIADPRIQELRLKMFDVLWDFKKRTPVMRELYEYAMPQVWYLTVPSKWNYKVYQPWVKNYDAEASVGYWGQPWRFVWIDRELKKSLGY